jgi:hypothetical protein
MELREMGCENGRWVKLTQDMVEWRVCEHSNEPTGNLFFNC